ncbi:MAG: response regulator [Desulfovibrionaceae bacterium]
MTKHSESSPGQPSPSSTASLREKLIGLGETSARKSYYPELQKQLEELQQFRSLLDHSNDAVILLETATRQVVGYNRTVCRMTGLEETEESCEAFLTIFRRPDIREALSRLEHTEDASEIIEADLQAVDRVVSLEISLRSVMLSGTSYAVIVARDVTERKNAKIALRQQQEFDATLAELSGRLLRPISLDEIAENVLRSAMNLTESPTGFVGTLERPLGRMVLQSVAGIGEMHLEGSGHIVLDQLDNIWGEIAFSGKTILINHASGTSWEKKLPEGHIPIRRLLCVPATSGSRVTGVIALANAPRDYTAQDQHYMERLAIPFSLAMQRKQFERELFESMEAAQSANKAKSEFLANMSHEIRTPLNGVLGMLQVLKETQMNSEQQEYVDVALRSGRGLLELLGDLLSLSEIESGHLSIRKQTFYLRELFEHVVQLFLPRTEAGGVALNLRMDPDLPELVTGDPGRVRQILFNLLGNSVKFTAQGRIDVSLTKLPGPLNDRFLRVLLLVEDTGIGIPEDKQQAVWEIFTQADGSSTRLHEGTGLGLHIVRRLVRAFGGEVCMDSTEGKGTATYVSLTFGLDVDPPMQAPVPERTSGRCLRVLLAEDDAVNRITALRFLERLGHSADVVENGKEAVLALKSKRYDAVLMDVQMPLMDGITATRAIRADPDILDSTTPIIALTAHALKGDKERFLNAGMNDYLAKPLEIRELQEALARISRH